MRIGVNTLFLIPGEVGGSETYLLETLRHAVEGDQGPEWVLFSNRENHGLLEGLFRQNRRVETRLVPVAARQRVRRILAEQFQLPAAVRDARIDVLWSPGYTAPWRTTCPQVVSVLDMQYREFPQDLGWLARLATGVLVPAAVKVARRVMTLSEFSRQQIVRYTGCAADKIVPIHLAASGAFATNLGEAGVVRRRQRVGDEPYILCVAHTYPHKNVHALVEACGQLERPAPVHLVLVGKPRRGEPLVGQAIRSCAGRVRVTRLEGLGREDLVALYQGAAVFAFPSLYEGFGLPVLEAMAAGVPVVTTDRGPMREIGGTALRLCDGSPAALARELQAILSLDDSGREQMVRCGRARAQEFTWSRTAALTTGVLVAAASRDDAAGCNRGGSRSR